MIRLAAALACLPALALADPFAAPRLGAATNFGQAWQPQMMQAARDLPLTDFRDAVYWRDIEASDGGYQFDGKRETWPDLLPDMDAGMSLTVNNGHPRWDDGHTPHSPDAVAAFARFAAAAVTRFPAIHSVEVGNEMNSATFVSGPGWDGDLERRAISYTALLAETARQVRAARPGTRILGGAAHSIPLAWFQALFGAGAAAHMDALVIHPDGRLTYRGAPVADAAGYITLRADDPEADVVRLVPDRDLPAAQLVALAADLRGAGATRVMIVTERGLE